MKLKHEGMNLNRLTKEADNPREVVFAEMWKRENSRRRMSLLAWILKDWVKDPCGRDANEVSQHDATVAATVIQWLGTNVGASFLTDVINAPPELKDYIRHGCYAEEGKRMKP